MTEYGLCPSINAFMSVGNSPGTKVNVLWLLRVHVSKYLFILDSLSRYHMSFCLASILEQPAILVHALNFSFRKKPLEGENALCNLMTPLRACLSTRCFYLRIYGNWSSFLAFKTFLAHPCICVCTVGSYASLSVCVCVCLSVHLSVCNLTKIQTKKKHISESLLSTLMSVGRPKST